MIVSWPIVPHTFVETMFIVRLRAIAQAKMQATQDGPVRLVYHLHSRLVTYKMKNLLSLHEVQVQGWIYQAPPSKTSDLIFRPLYDCEEGSTLLADLEIVE